MACLRWCVLAAAAVTSAAAAVRAPTDRPNIVMVFVDDLGYGDTGFNGHPTTVTPNIDALAAGGKILSTWYSGYCVCTASRAALMTGRQPPRYGIPGVIGPVVQGGMNLNESTVANLLKPAGYATAIVGKWHLGQRDMYLPASRGFDHYLGIPYSDDMGEAKASPCNTSYTTHVDAPLLFSHEHCREMSARQDVPAGIDNSDDVGYEHHSRLGEVPGRPPPFSEPPLPLLHQTARPSPKNTSPSSTGTVSESTTSNISTTILEQPVDLTNLATKYRDFAVSFVEDHKEAPFFLYAPLSHVHTTAANQPEKQYAGCAFQNTTQRGKFGDALAEADWIVGEIMEAVDKAGLRENTLLLFTGDNGPWLAQGTSGGSYGLLTGQGSGYWNTGKGSTWEGGIREAAFAHWPGQIKPSSRTPAIVSSLDVLPTVLDLAGVALPKDRAYDGESMRSVLTDARPAALPHQDGLFFYSTAQREDGPVAMRLLAWKAHWVTFPGLGGCSQDNCKTIKHDPPLLFNVERDPSEAYPLQAGDLEYAVAIKAVRAAYEKELATFVFGTMDPAPGAPPYAVCCDAAKQCDCSGPPSPGPPPASFR